MERLNRSTAVYQGLFLIGLALFANEHRKKLGAITPSVRVTAPQVVEENLSLLDSVYQKLQAYPIFKTLPDGVSLGRKKHLIWVGLQNDELYRDGETAVEEAWYPVFDQIGQALNGALKSELKPELQLSIVGFANSLNETESRGVAFQSSPYLFSASRAEWVYRYFESKYHLAPQVNAVLIAGRGAIPNGKRIEIRIEEN